MIDPRVTLDKYRRFVRSDQRYRSAVVLDYLPFERYHVYDRWRPDRVKVLFLAESPPWDETVYFYNERRRGGLSRALFHYLGIEEATKSEELVEFKRRGLFLIDTIKCIFRKNVRKKIPDELVRFSAREILEDEIEALKPSLICVMGETALKGIKYTDRFSPWLSLYESIADASGKSVIAGGTKLVMSVFPNTRNRRYEETIRRAMEDLRPQRMTVGSRESRRG